jgi:hypothetical protein
MWKEAVVTKFEVQVYHEDYVRVAGLRTEMWTWEIPIT